MADRLLYEEAPRRATYTTNAHASGPQGDLWAAKIEMYLKPSGNELDRVEAYDQGEPARRRARSPRATA